jgi:hypothetical protein
VTITGIEVTAELLNASHYNMFEGNTLTYSERYVSKGETQK